MSRTLPPRWESLLVGLAAATVAALWAWLPPSPRFVADLNENGIFLGFSPDGTLLAAQPVQRLDEYQDTAIGPIRFWDVATGRERAPLVQGHGLLGPGRFCSSGKFLVAKRDEVDRVKFLDAVTGQECVNLGGWDGCLSPDGRVLAFALPPEAEGRNGSNSPATWSRDARALAKNRIKLWDMTEQREMAVLGQGTPWFFSPDGKTLVSFRMLSGNNPFPEEISLWDVAQTRLRAAIKLSSHCSSARFSPDGRTLSLHVYGGAGVPCCVRLVDVETGTERANLVNAYESAFLRNGEVVATFCRDPLKGFGVRCWDVATGQETAKFQLDRPGWACYGNSLAPSPDGKTVAFAVSYNSQTILSRQFSRWSWMPAWLREGASRNEVKVLDTETGREVATFDPPHGGWPEFSPDGKLLALYRRNGTTDIWELPPPRPVGRLLGLSGLLVGLVAIGLWRRTRRLKKSPPAVLQ
jgi:WD40 repeat protein